MSQVKRIRGWVRSSMVLAAFIAAGPASAALFTFSGSHEGGVGSATMNVSIAGSTLTATVNNTSPTDLIGAALGSGGNSPGIAGFGLNVDPSTLSLSGWSLTAYTNANQTGLTTIGGTSSCLGCDWIMGMTQAGVTLDYLPQVLGGVDGLLYNPAVFDDQNNELPGGGNSVYYTTAILTMNFDDQPTLSIGEESVYIRMQNVGLNAEGSLKLFGKNGGGGGDDDDTPMPEPATLALVGLGLLGAAVARRRRR